MRIAVCLYGQTRSGSVHAIPSILRYIGDLLPSCDIFIHTWDIESLGTAYAKLFGKEHPNETDVMWHTTMTATKKRFSELFEKYCPKAMEVEEYKLQNTKDTWGGRRFDPVSGLWNVSMWKSIQEVNNIKTRYSVKNAFSYDYTVILRSDIVFGSSKSLSSDISEITDSNMMIFGDLFNIWPQFATSRIEEIIWIGQTSVIDKVANFSTHYSKTVENLDDPNHPTYRDWQFYAADWITQTLGIRFTPMKNSIMRACSQVDIDNSIDPLNPGFGSPPGRFNQKR